MPWVSFRSCVAPLAVLLLAVACSGRSGRTPGTGAPAGEGGNGATSGGTGGNGGSGGTATAGKGGAAGGAGGAAGSGVGGTGTGGASTGGTGGTGGEAGEGNPGGRGGTAGGGGSMDAGPPDMTDEEVCTAACEAAPSVELPAAFCEDWMWADNYADAEFCGSVSGSSCEERCVTRLGAVSDPCHEALRAAIPCAAMSDLYSGSGVPQPSGCLLGECFAELTVVTSVCNGAQEALDAARALWETEGSDDYSYAYGAGNDAPVVEVVMGVASQRSGEPIADPQTIVELFDAMQAVLDRRDILRAAYDETLGYPSEVEFVRPMCGGESVLDAFVVTNLVLE